MVLLARSRGRRVEPVNPGEVSAALTRSLVELTALISSSPRGFEDEALVSLLTKSIEGQALLMCFEDKLALTYLGIHPMEGVKLTLNVHVGFFVRGPVALESLPDNDCSTKGPDRWNSVSTGEYEMRLTYCQPNRDDAFRHLRMVGAIHCYIAGRLSWWERWARELPRHFDIFVER